MFGVPAFGVELLKGGIRMSEYLSMCCKAFPNHDTLDTTNVGMCSECDGKSVFYEEDEVPEIMYLHNEERKNG